MRILFWTHAFWPQIGGIEAVAAKLLPALQQRGYECLVVTHQYSPELPEEEYYQDIPIFRFPFWKAVSTHDPNRVAHVRQQITTLKRTFAPDLVHLNNALDLSQSFYLVTAEA